MLFQKNFEGGLSLFKVEAEMFLTYMGMLFSLHQHQLEEKNNFGAV